MYFSSTIWRCIIILLTFSFRGCPLLPAHCERFIHLGNLTVEPAPPFLLGSNMTVYCHINECERRFKLSLELNWKIVRQSKRVNCTTAVFVPRVLMPQSFVVCKMKHEDFSVQTIVSGLTLNAGLPPDKPGNISCETTRSSEVIHCSWQRGKETHLHDSFNISVSRENGTQIHAQIRDAEEITLPRAILDEKSKYLLTVTTYNHFGTSQSDPFILCVKDIVIPETPHIVTIEFGNNSMTAILHWKTSESALHLRSHVRLRTDNLSWEVGEVSELGEGRIRVDNLRPLSEYEFQMRTCDSASGLKQTNAPSFASRWTFNQRTLCSQWSPSVRKESPGKSPSQQLHVWRTLGGQDQNGLRRVTVLWKPLPPWNYSGEVQHYKIFLANDHEETCAAATSMCSVQVPAGVQALNVCAVTSYGTSPPAVVELRHSGILGPILQELVSAVNDDAVLVSWSSALGGQLLYYVMEWASVPAKQLQWEKIAKDRNSTSITGLIAGVRYNVSLYAVTTRGVSAPTSSLVYSREQKPVSGPNLRVLVHETRRILIQWNELPVDQQRGFVTKYTIYVRTLDSNTELIEIVSASSPRQIWLDTPEGVLALHLTASNSAGEGPRGSRISSQPAAPAVGMGIVIVFIVTIFIVIVVNLMCWSCVRKRIKQKLKSWGPAWLVENLPKPGHSNAIRLLEEDGSEPLFSSTCSDPPLSPIFVISQEERDEVYPILHVEVSQIRSVHTTEEHPLSMSNTRTMPVDHAGYKPQITTLVPPDEEEAAEETQRDAPAEEDRCSSVFEGLLGGLLSSVNVDFSDSSQGLNLGSVGGLFWPKTAETKVLNKAFLGERRGTENDVEGDSPPLDLQQDEKMTLDTTDICLSQCTGEITLNGGYFPQLTTISTTILDTQM
ncbi:interleukin-23 receptor isoform 2-T3 [Odontesthes bonariensis]|uniref:interleukin-23 receptor isoform X2 n=1 Tax=Odontesthes bonariensis TaxID=219752 RepID=UPI003F580A5A